jgi:hypothetical protein
MNLAVGVARTDDRGATDLDSLPGGRDDVAGLVVCRGFECCLFTSQQLRYRRAEAFARPQRSSPGAIAL